MNKEKIIKVYDFIMFTILICLICFCAFSINAYAKEDTEWIGSYTGECTLYSLSNGSSIAIPNEFIETHKDFIIYKTSVTNTYCLFIPNFDTYSYSINSITPTHIDGTTYSKLTDYLLSIEDYSSYPMFLVQGYNFVEGENTLTLKYWEQEDATDIKLSSDKAYACTSMLGINNNGFFFDWIQEGTLAEILMMTNLNPLGWVTYLIPLVMVSVVLVIGLKKALVMLQVALHKA